MREAEPSAGTAFEDRTARDGMGSAEGPGACRDPRRVLLSGMMLLCAGCYWLVAGGRVPAPPHPVHRAPTTGASEAVAVPDMPGIPPAGGIEAAADARGGAGDAESGRDAVAEVSGAGTPFADAPPVGAGPLEEPAWRDFRVRRGDTLSGLFARAGLAPADLAALMGLGGRVDALSTLHPGDVIQLRLGARGELRGLRYPLDGLATLVVSSRDGRLHPSVVHEMPTARPVVARGTVRHSLARAMRRAGVAPAVVARVERAFHWRVDFRRDIREGTRFSVIYERLYAAGREVGTGRLIAAALDLGPRTLRMFRFDDGSGEARYYDESGRSLAPSLLRTPVHYKHMSSPFSRRRFDPVRHVWRPHWGVDLAAPAGTPIVAAGDGAVTFAGREGGYGRLITIRHSGAYATRYAHLLRFAPGMRIGARVRQGEVIGYVGRSGEATGPHLHFEIRVGGKPRNPLTMPLPGAPPLPPRMLEAFHRSIAPLQVSLDRHDGGGDTRALASLDHEPAEQLAAGPAGVGS